MGLRTSIAPVPHWTWPGKEGQEIEGWFYSNQKRIELFLNGIRLGSQNVEKNGHLSWKVKYAPGMLDARASNNGSVLLTAANETAGAPAKLALTTDRVQIHADGEDVSIVATRVLDAANRIVPELLTKSLSI